MVESVLQSIKTFLVNAKYYAKEVFVINSMIETSPWTYKIKNFRKWKVVSGEQIINGLLSRTRWLYQK